MNDLSLAPAAKTQTDRVYSFLLEKIHQGYWPVNAKIMTENELCATLRVSRIAVREAVERLAALGLLVKKQGSGTYVAKPAAESCFDSLFQLINLDRENTKQLLEFRKSFESQNIKLFMKYHVPEDVAALENNYREMLATRYSDPGLSGRLDFEFHQIIAMGTRNPFVIRICRILTGILRSHQEELYRTADQDNAYQYHKDIIAHIKSGDAKVAVALMRRHIKISTKAFLRHHKSRRPGTDGVGGGSNAVSG
ncbi:MAG: FCD domain-containing protein [Planctomycetota bacterium]|jgi:DNA-binding FadR family transcriptional regulator|nr:FCD domain-containing protein [Planctomycetota bacterium]